jgi:drug/metabolite transporter (DMT)-like permease
MAIVGVLLMVFQGLILTTQLVIGALLKRAQWPFYRICAVAMVATSICIIVAMSFTKVELPDRRAQRWLIGRGIFGTASFTFMSLAVRVGTPAGDVAALTSINTVVAAFAGRLFLNEPMRWSHVLASLTCICGASLITEPKFIFGRSENRPEAGLGYSFALVGGFCQAGIAVCSRKIGGLSLWWSTLPVAVFSSLAWFALSALGILNDFTFQHPLASPVECLLWCVLLFILGTSAIVAQNAAGQCCRTSVIATVGTGARMVWGYVGDISFFGREPAFHTVSGAMLMLASVFAVALESSSQPSKVHVSFIAASFSTTSFNLNTLELDAEAAIQLPRDQSASN